MSGNYQRFHVMFLDNAFRSVTTNEDWAELRAWLTTHAPESEARRTVERITALVTDAVALLEALEWSPRNPGAEALPLTAIARQIEGDDGLDQALASVRAWRLPGPEGL